MRKYDRNSLAIYLDELDNDPDKACASVRSLGLSTICLRKVRSGNSGKASDDSCKQLLSTITKSKLNVLTVCSDDGREPTDQLKFGPLVRRSIAIAGYFKAKYFRPMCGLKSQQIADDKLNEWMDAISGECIKANITPIMEIDTESYASEPSEVASLLEKHKTWRLLYDPAPLIIKRNQNVLVKYWHLLRNKAVQIDLHDFKIGNGFMPLGMGDCHLDGTIRDCVSNNLPITFILEPGTFRRASTTPRIDIIQAIITNFLQIVNKNYDTTTSWSNNHGKKRTK